MLLSYAGPIIGTEKARTLAAHVNALEYAPSVEIIAACLRP
jgi:hypothetical protein